MDNEEAGQSLYPDLTTTEASDAATLEAEEKLDDPDPHLEMKHELEKTEEEINTLRQVLQAKEHYAAELRKKLGLTPLSQLSQSFKAELNKVQSSTAYKKTSETLKSAGQSTASAISSLGSSVSQKFSEMKNSTTFKSFEEKVEGVGSTFMAKVTGTADKNKDIPEEGKEMSEDSSPVTEQPHQQTPAATAPPL